MHTAAARPAALLRRPSGASVAVEGLRLRRCTLCFLFSVLCAAGRNAPGGALSTPSVGIDMKHPKHPTIRRAMHILIHRVTALRTRPPRTRTATLTPPRRTVLIQPQLHPPRQTQRLASHRPVLSLNPSPVRAFCSLWPWKVWPFGPARSVLRSLREAGRLRPAPPPACSDSPAPGSPAPPPSPDNHPAPSHPASSAPRNHPGSPQRTDSDPP